MSVLDLFRRKASTTSAWREDLRVPLVADLDRFELSGVGFGEALDRLSFLGPSRSEFLDYPRKGLYLDADGISLSGFVLALRRDAYLGSYSTGRPQAFAGRIRFGGRDWAPQELRGEGDFVAGWGQPYWRDVDEGEVLLFFEFSAAEVQIEFSLEGVPQVLIATPEPLMAQAEQRLRYGVDKPWPPVRYPLA